MSTGGRVNSKRRPRRKGIEIVPSTKKDMEGSVTETLLRDHEGIETLEGQLDDILQAWIQTGIAPISMVYLATQLQELSMVLYHDGYLEFVTGTFGKLSKKNREQLESNFENMCKVIRRRSLNALVSRSEERDKDGENNTDMIVSQRSARSNEEMPYVPSKEKPWYIN